MKVVDLLTAQPVMQEVMDRKMPAKLAYGLAKNFRLINIELEDYNKARLKILNDNWTLDEANNKFQIPEEDQEKWKKLHQELLDTECDYQPYMIDISLTEKIEWSPNELLNLWFIFEGDGASDLVPSISK